MSASANEELHRAIGRLESKVDTILTDALPEIKRDVKALNQFKWRVAGGAAVLSVLLSIVMEVLHLLK